jgi:antagonist of KipI
MIEVLEPGRFTSIQDHGRPGFERYGVPAGGAADWFAAAVANRLVGNQRQAALLEMTAFGASLRFHQDAIIAMTGATSLSVTGLSDCRAWQACPIASGSRLDIGPITPGLRSYVAVRGGIEAPLVLQSRSLCARGGFGGGFGRPLRSGDHLPVGTTIVSAPLEKAWPGTHRLPLQGPWEVRVIAGPHSDVFASGALERVNATACRATSAIDRMGLRLETPGLHLEAEEILTTPVASGSIQVTPSGELIVLLVDHPTTGGYPVIATAINADLPLLAQVRPGDTIRFRRVDQVEAASARRRLMDWLELE